MSAEVCAKCGAPSTYGQPPRCRKCAIADLDRMIAAVDRNSSLRWRLESDRVRLLCEKDGTQPRAQSRGEGA